MRPLNERPAAVRLQLRAAATATKPRSVGMAGARIWRSAKTSTLAKVEAPSMMQICLGVRGRYQWDLLQSTPPNLRQHPRVGRRDPLHLGSGKKRGQPPNPLLLHLLKVGPPISPKQLARLRRRRPGKAAASAPIEILWTRNRQQRTWKWR